MKIHNEAIKTNPKILLAPVLKKYLLQKYAIHPEINENNINFTSSYTSIIFVGFTLASKLKKVTTSA